MIWYYNHLPIFVSTLLICSVSFYSDAGYGDCFDTIPSSFEREVHVMTNAVRMDPTGFRDHYIVESSILLPENYPAVAPLWYNNDLSIASRFHSVEMANTCGMQHESCNGTKFDIRIRSFYKTGNRLAENVATGNPTGLKTVIQWLRDDNSQGIPATDKTPGAGHRENIMNPAYQELGTGYAYSATRNYNHFWTQDFGNGKPGQLYKIPAGCHFKPDSYTLSYAANYYDQLGSGPKSATVIIDSDSYPMTLQLGMEGKGTYVYSSTNDNIDHCYFFIFIDANGDTIRFPEMVNLTTGTQLCCKSSVKSASLLKVINNKESFSGKNLHYLLDGKIISGESGPFRSAGITVKSEINGVQKKMVIQK